MDASIPFFVVIPLAAAFTIPLCARAREVAVDLVACGTLATLGVLALSSIGLDAHYRVGNWPAPLGIEMRLDALAALLLVLVNVIAFLAALYSVEYMREYTAKHRYYALLLLMVAGMNGVVLAGDLFNLYVMMEIAAVASYALVAFGCAHEELEASFKYAVLGTLASTMILIAIALIYSLTGSLSMVQIAEHVEGLGDPRALLLASALFLCGFGLKAALVPFHTWLPDAHPSAPAPISAMLSGVLIKAIGIYALVRIVFNVIGAGEGELAALRWLGMLSMVIGGVLAAGQSDIKRLLAYSSIGQMGYVALGFGLATPLGVVGAVYHLVNHAVFKSLLFLNAGAVEQATGTRELSRLGGLARRMPVTGATSLVASLSVAGLPPFNGFFSKLIVIVACVQAGEYGFALVAALMSAVTLVYQLRIQRHAFAGPPRAGEPAVGPERPLMAAVMLVLATACVGLSGLVVTGLQDPLLIGDAQRVVLAGSLAPGTAISLVSGTGAGP